ncbi:MAG: hypothetical protein AAFW98_09100, partial [Pseudomonadota bacterium]
MTRRRPLRPDEKLLWEKVARTVAPLRSSASRKALDAGGPEPAPGVDPPKPAKTPTSTKRVKSAPRPHQPPPQGAVKVARRRW